MLSCQIRSKRCTLPFLESATYMRVSLALIDNPVGLFKIVLSEPAFPYGLPAKVTPVAAPLLHR